MAAAIGNLSVIISGNAKPFHSVLQGVKGDIRAFGGTVNNTFNIRPPSGSQANSMHLQWGSFGRLARSALVSGFGGGLAGGLAGALVGIGAMAFGQLLEASLSLVGTIGHQTAAFLASSFDEGLKSSRMEMGVRFLAGTGARGDEWMKMLRSLSASSGFDMTSLGQSMRALAGSTDELDNVVPTLRAIAEISAGIGAESEQMNRFALAVAQVISAGRFEAQELNQLTEAGMPIKELAKTVGMTTGKFRAAVKDGEISVNVLAETFNRMVGPGGKFFDMLAERSKTAVGQFDQATAKWLLFKQELGKGLLEALQESGGLQFLRGTIDFLMQNKDEIRQFFKDAGNGIMEFGEGFARFAGNIAMLLDTLEAMIDLFTHGLTAGVNGAAEAVDSLVSLYAPKIGILAHVMGNRWEAGVGSVGKSNLFGAPGVLLDGLMNRRGGTGDKWAEWFRDMRFGFHQIRNDATSAFEPIHTAAALAPRLQKMLDEATEKANRGGAYQQFQKAVEDLKTIRNFNSPSIWMKAWGSAAGKELNPLAFGGQNAAAENQILLDAYRALEQSMKAATSRFPEAMERGSQAAASAILQAAYGNDNRTVQEKMLDTLKFIKESELRREQTEKEQLRHLRAISGLPALG